MQGPVLTCHESRELNCYATEEFGMSSLILMENAGRSVVDYLLARYQQGNILVCSGKSNNAGDGFVIARHLDNHRTPEKNF